MDLMLQDGMVREPDVSSFFVPKDAGSLLTS